MISGAVSGVALALSLTLSQPTTYEVHAEGMAMQACDDSRWEYEQPEEEIPIAFGESATKTYMPWRMVTNKQSIQYYVLRDGEAYTDEETGFRMVGDRVCIAMGTGYDYSPGDFINVNMESGETIHCILGDMKADVDTDDQNLYQKEDGSVVEIIVDYDYFSPGEYPKEWEGEIKSVVRVGNLYCSRE